MPQNNTIYELWKLSCFPISSQIKILFGRNIHAHTAYDHIIFKRERNFNKAPKWPTYYLIITKELPQHQHIKNKTLNLKLSQLSRKKPQPSRIWLQLT